MTNLIYTGGALLLQLLGGYLLLNVLYLLFFAVAGHRKRPARPAVAATRRAACAC